LDKLDSKVFSKEYRIFSAAAVVFKTNNLHRNRVNVWSKGKFEFFSWCQKANQLSMKPWLNLFHFQGFWKVFSHLQKYIYMLILIFLIPYRFTSYRILISIKSSHSWNCAFLRSSSLWIPDLRYLIPFPFPQSEERSQSYEEENYPVGKLVSIYLYHSREDL